MTIRTRLAPPGRDLPTHRGGRDPDQQAKAAALRAAGEHGASPLANDLNKGAKMQLRPSHGLWVPVGRSSTGPNMIRCQPPPLPPPTAQSLTCPPTRTAMVERT